ncbi:MAG: NYN domain protein [Bacteroidetes bacterium ADurb.Bin174]|nr:MAG: NYN domain protein [Bacteroidetes bacterium ADurb.Bin174]
MTSKRKQKVIAYIDGFNFYYGLKDRNWKKFYWLDIVKFIEKNLRSHQELLEVHYFSAIPNDKGKASRQDKLFQANKLNPKFFLHLGKYLPKRLTCYGCGRTIHSYEEKETDVRIASSMLYDCFVNKSDVVILVSADSDLIPPIEIMRQINPMLKIIVFFPPKRFSNELRNICDSYKNLNGSFRVFADSALPEEIELPNGFILERPDSWK